MASGNHSPTSHAAGHNLAMAFQVDGALNGSKVLGEIAEMDEMDEGGAGNKLGDLVEGETDRSGAAGGS